MQIYSVRRLSDGVEINRISASADHVSRFLAENPELLAVPEVVPLFYATAAEASAAMVLWIDRLTGAVLDLYPAAIQGGWVEEEAMAEAYLAGFEDAAQRATLQADADAKGRSMADHAARILENAHLFRTIAKQARTLWLATDAALAAATDPDQYAAILASAAAQGATLAATYGLAVPPP
jgi:hypothetical protein